MRELRFRPCYRFYCVLIAHPCASRYSGGLCGVWGRSTLSDLLGYRRGAAAEQLCRFLPQVVAPQRFETVLESLREPGSAVILLGPPGSGRSRLAEEAAHALEQRLETPVSVTIMSAPPGLESGHAAVFGFYFPEILEPEQVTISLSEGGRWRHPAAALGRPASTGGTTR